VYALQTRFLGDTPDACADLSRRRPRGVPRDHKKTTICHIPPGNPANAHTICVGNAAVPAHLHNHGDYLGVCIHETPCPPPPTGTAGGGDDTGGAGGSPTGTAGTGSAGSTTAGAAGSSAGGAGGGFIVP
jgi:hypothetical protein